MRLAATCLFLCLACCSPSAKQPEAERPPAPALPRAEVIARAEWSGSFCNVHRYVDVEHGNVIYVLIGDYGRSAAMAAVPIGADKAP